jgi:hypothetical protein
MTPKETVMLARYVKACCPQQQIDEFTPDAWHDLLGDLSLDDCRNAAAAVAKRQPFVAPAEIRAEVRRIRDDRLSRAVLPAPPPEIADYPVRYRASLAASISSIANGRSVRRALEAPGRGSEPPAAYTEARDGLGQASRKPTPQEIAAQQAEDARNAREQGGREPAA